MTEPRLLSATTTPRHIPHSTFASFDFKYGFSLLFWESGGGQLIFTATQRHYALRRCVEGKQLFPFPAATLLLREEKRRWRRRSDSVECL